MFRLISDAIKSEHITTLFGITSSTQLKAIWIATNSAVYTAPSVNLPYFPILNSRT